MVEAVVVTQPRLWPGMLQLEFPWCTIAHHRDTLAISMVMLIRVVSSTVYGSTVMGVLSWFRMSGGPSALPY